MLHIDDGFESGHCKGQACLSATLVKGRLGLSRLAIYPGSFNPVTIGHLAIIHKAAKLFDSDPQNLYKGKLIKSNQMFFTPKMENNAILCHPEQVEIQYTFDQED